MPSDSSVALSAPLVMVGTTKLPLRRSVVRHIQKGAPKSVMTSPTLTRKRAALWIATAEGW